MRRNPIIVLFVALALLAGACSGSDDAAAGDDPSLAGGRETPATVPPTSADPKGEGTPELGGLQLAICNELIDAIELVEVEDGRNLLVAMDAAAAAVPDPYRTALQSTVVDGQLRMNAAADADSNAVVACGFPFIQAAITKFYTGAPGCYLSVLREPVETSWCGLGEPVVAASPVSIDGNPAEYCSAALNLRNRVDRGVDAEAQLELVQALAAVSPPSVEDLLGDLFRLLDEQDSVFTVWGRPEALTPLLAIDRATFRACREAYADQLLVAVLGAEDTVANPTTTTTSTTTTAAPVLFPPVCFPLVAIKPFDLDNVGRYGPPLVTAQQTGAPDAVINALTRLVQGNGVVADVLTLVNYDDANCRQAPVAPGAPPGPPVVPTVPATTTAPTTTAFPAP